LELNRFPQRLAARLGLGLVALPLASAAFADDQPMRVDVVVEMTEAGKKVAHPTPAKPAYYFPLSAGFSADGDVMTFFQRPPPDSAEIESLLAKTLADQGYLLATKAHPPSLILMFRWGYMAPIIIDDLFVNEGQMWELVGGKTIDTPWPIGPRKLEVVESARTARWYMTVVAADYNDWKYHHKATKLWHESMSTELWGHYFDEALPTLIANGAASFGRETGPQMIQAPVVPMGHVVVGTPYLRPDPTGPAAPAGGR